MIPIAKPLLGKAEADAAAATVLSGWLSQGPAVAAFEAAFAARVGAPHACAVSNCTTGLHLALLATGVERGDEVITVSSSFIATANVIRYLDAIPVFVDIQPDTLNIDPGAVERAITPRTRAILCVHQMGMPCDVASIVRIASAHGIPVIEDAACAIGSRILIDDAWQEIGAPVADVAVFSFHPRKVMTTGEGGMLTTRNPAWDQKFRLWRQHGMSVPDTVRHGSATVVFEDYTVTGYNYRMTDMQAAVGLAQLDRLPGIIEARRALAVRYGTLLADMPYILTPTEPNWAQTNWQSYCVRLPAWCDQRAVMQSMLDAGIATRRGIMCAHLEQAYAGLGQRFDLRQSERARDACILLPLYPQMTADEQAQVVAALRAATVLSARGRPMPGSIGVVGREPVLS